MAEPQFLTLDQVLEIHRAQLELFGGQEGIRDQAALDCALTFLEANGFSIEDFEMELYQAMIDVGSKKLSKKGLEDLFQKLANQK